VPGVPRPQLPREVVRLGWVSFWLDVASEMVYPLVPLFVATLVAAPGLTLGLIEGAADGVLSILTALSGRASDRLGRRVPFIRAGYSLSAASKPLLALVTGWPALLGLRVADRTGKGLRTAARDALIADLTPPEQRGAAYGFHRSMDTAGALVGVLLALGLLQLLPGEYRTIFAIAAVPGVLAVALTFRIRESVKTAPAPPGPPPSWRSLPPSFWRVCTPLWVFALGASSDAFLLLRSRESGFSETQVILAYALMNLCYALSAAPAGRLSDRLGRARTIALGWALFAVVYARFALHEFEVLWILFALYGVFLGLTQGVGRAWITDHAPAEQRGTALGVHQLGLGLIVFASNALTGVLWDSVGPSAAFGFGAVTSVVALALLYWAARTTRVDAR
jgi:MFS family permease